MTPDQLITFSVVAEHANISHAARTLNLSQPAVSGQLQALQHTFGEPLYRRNGKGIRLTAAGLRLLGPADRIRAAMREALQERQAMQGLEHGSLSIGASTTPASYLLPEFVATFKKNYPSVHVRLSAGNTQEIMDRLKDFDIAVVEGELPPEHRRSNHAIDWQVDEVVAIVPTGHRLAKRSCLSLGELNGESLVMREDGSGVRNLVMQAFSEAGLPLGAYLELAGVEGIKQAVRAGLGVGFVSRLSLGHEDGTLTGIRVGDGDGLTRTIRIVTPGGQRPSRVAQSFLSLLGMSE